MNQGVEPKRQTTEFFACSLRFRPILFAFLRLGDHKFDFIGTAGSYPDAM